VGAVLAIDGGNTKTDVALVAADGTLLASVRGGGSNYQGIGTERMTQVLTKLVAEADTAAGLRSGGRVEAHTSACLAGDSTPLVTASSGVGRSTLLLAEIAAGGRATADNLSVADGMTVWGLVEPMRVEGGGGRRMPHGRHERDLEARADALTPDCVVVLERGDGSSRASLTPCSAEAATRALVTGTYMAGDLRRYWQFAAILTAGTGRGPAHPPVAEIASTFAARLPAFVMTLGPDRTMRLSQLLETATVRHDGDRADRDRPRRHPAYPRIRERRAPADRSALAVLEAGVADADLAAPAAVTDFHLKADKEMPSSIAVATRDVQHLHLLLP
jgi:hypothetical protein